MILAFDTSTDWLTIAIGEPGEVVAQINESAPRAHLNRLMPGIDTVVKQAKIKPGDIKHIAVGIGPGSFTGTRIAVSAARGLAQAIACPLVGISTLDILAMRPNSKGEIVYPVLDARRQEVYTAGYDKHGCRFTDYMVLQPQELAEKLSEAGQSVVLTGDGLTQYSDIFRAALGTSLTVAEPILWTPDASVLIGLAREKIDKEQIEPYFKVLPIYIRLSDAEETAKRKKLS